MHRQQEAISSGVKVHLLVTAEGNPVEVPPTLGGRHDPHPPSANSTLVICTSEREVARCPRKRVYSRGLQSSWVSSDDVSRQTTAPGGPPTKETAGRTAAG